MATVGDCKFLGNIFTSCVSPYPTLMWLEVKFYLQSNHISVWTNIMQDLNLGSAHKLAKVVIKFRTTILPNLLILNTGWWRRISLTSGHFKCCILDIILPEKTWKGIKTASLLKNLRLHPQTDYWQLYSRTSEFGSGDHSTQ